MSRGQGEIVRCPRHTIQFLNYGYTQYIEEILKLLDIDISSLEWKEYETWTPYMVADRQD